ncbi:alpha/beta hydrolase [Halomonas sp. DQ26W]|uniref:alpha/beta hydrolase n=1 Tax=Halomonas sp. DQ26W TaxID=2282311 RepID=UPI000DF7C9B2|nr:alpha/beta hydrolase [Halomonas sp. DQ26W]RDB41890.1 alpha/beta hydrolase [Halomonas sp. DQ26W]
MLYREFATQEEIDREYDPSKGRDPLAMPKLLEGWRERSEASRARYRATEDLAYGPTLAECMDIYHADGDVSADSRPPVHLFFHGGYWRSLSHKDFGFVVDGLVEAGITVAVVNYALCPSVPFGELVRQSRAAVAWMHRYGESLGVDPHQLSVSGHSAGGHLCAMLLVTDWEEDYGLPNDLIRSALAISGLFDLRPFPWSWLQPKLQLTGRDVADYSPLFQPCRVPARVSLVAGGKESSEFERQMLAHGEHLRGQGIEANTNTLDTDDHFSILDHYRPGGRFVEWIRGCHP